jgi:hypothetical protein
LIIDKTDATLLNAAERTIMKELDLIFKALPHTFIHVYSVA